MSLDNLKKIIKSCAKKKIPEFSGLDALDDWIENLIEVDSFLAGLASSVISGFKIKKTDLPSIDGLLWQFNEISFVDNRFEKSYLECKSYLDLLLKLYNELKNLLHC